MGKGKRNPDTPIPFRSFLKHLPETRQLARTVAHEYIAQSGFDPQSVISSSQYSILVTKFRDGANIVAETPLMQQLFRDTYFKKGKLMHRRRRVICVDEFHEALLSFPLHTGLAQLHDSLIQRFTGLPASLVDLWHARLAEPQYEHLVEASRAAAAAKAAKEEERCGRNDAYRLEREGKGAGELPVQPIANRQDDVAASIPNSSTETASAELKIAHQSQSEERTPSSSLVDAPALDVSAPHATAKTDTSLSSSLIDCKPPSSVSIYSPSDDNTAEVQQAICSHARTVDAKRGHSNAPDDTLPSPKRIKSEHDLSASSNDILSFHSAMDNQLPAATRPISRESISRPSTPRRGMPPSLSPLAPSANEPRISPNTERHDTDILTRQRHTDYETDPAAPPSHQSSQTSLARPDTQDNLNDTLENAHVRLSVVDSETGVEHVLRLFVESDDEDVGGVSDEDEHDSEMEEEIHIYGACRYAVADDDDDETDEEDGKPVCEDSDDEDSNRFSR
ncbi:hypothetical protein BDZ89DRAFT_1111424 [Hymenopellis radicata]|nr:hypothetical protein BDZ89DRAFT_1111424 [Hymenopellis radicata]